MAQKSIFKEMMEENVMLKNVNIILDNTPL